MRDFVWRQLELCVFQCVASATHFFIQEEKRNEEKITALTLVLCMAFCLVSCNKIEQNVNVNTYDEEVNATVSQENDENNEIVYSDTENKYPIQQATESQHTQSIMPNTKPQTQRQTTTTTKAAHIHSFSSANCTQPQKCSCGATLGSPLGHSYSSATCTSPKKCSRCGTTSGSALGHNYKSGKCTRCGKTDPNSLPVRLEKLQVVDYSGTFGYTYEYVSGAIKDTYGNQYSGYHLFRTLVETRHVSFALNGAYSKLTFDLFSPETMNPGYTNGIEVYVDGVLKYRNNNVTRTTKKIPVSIDVRGGDVLTFKAVRIDGDANYSSQLAIGNAQLTK